MARSDQPANSARAGDTARACPACSAPKPARHYLCRGCWFALNPATRRALNRHDPLAGQRLLELHRQLRRDVPLAEITVTP